MSTPEELKVGRRNLLAQLRHDLDRDLTEYPVDAGTMRELVEVLEGVRVVPSLAQIDTALRNRLIASNFNDNLHEPIRTQTIDVWSDLLAGAVLNLMGGEKP